MYNRYMQARSGRAGGAEEKERPARPAPRERQTSDLHLTAEPQYSQILPSPIRAPQFGQRSGAYAPGFAAI